MNRAPYRLAGFVGATFMAPLIVFVLVTTSEKEIICATFVAKMTAGEEIAAVFTNLAEADRTFVHPAFFF